MLTFNVSLFKKKKKKPKIQSCPSTPYNPSANGLAEAFHKTLCKILKKMVSSHKRDWSDKLPEALWAYRTTVRGQTHSTPFSLVYGCEVVVPPRGTNSFFKGISTK